ncbi:hypothetical protein Vafri_21461, partial [Volvox africanus]
GLKTAADSTGDSGDGLGRCISGGSAATAATTAAKGSRKWLRRNWRSGGGGSTSQLSAIHLNAAMLAAELSKRSAKGITGPKVLLQRRGGVAPLGGSGGSYAGRIGNARGSSWLAAKWAALRCGGGRCGSGGGGGDVEMGPDSMSNGGGFELPRAAALVRTRVEPKTFFAAERTFLSWLNIAVLVMFTSLSLMSDRLALFGNAVRQSSIGCLPGGICQASQIAGMAMAPVSMAFMLYALFMYRKRSAQILRRESVRYDDQRGPVLLTCMLLVVLVIAYVLTVKSVS